MPPRSTIWWNKPLSPRKASKSPDAARPAAGERIKGQVVANYGHLLVVETDDGRLLKAGSLRRLGYVACGDRVWCEHQSGQQARVIDREPRQTSMERVDNRGRVRVLASGFDRLVIVAADPPGFDHRLIDQYLVMAAHLGVEPLLLFNKVDLWGRTLHAEADRLRTLYTGLGFALIGFSARSGEGLVELRAALRGHVSILVGQSGVGKSSIAGALLPDREIRVGELSSATGLGSHTTTSTILYRLPSGGALIDSPGVREFALGHLPVTAVIRGFPEIDGRADGCRFHNCQHRQEPDCQVRQAVELGEIDAGRYQDYLAFMDDAGSLLDRRRDA